LENFPDLISVGLNAPRTVLIEIHGAFVLLSINTSTVRKALRASP
jgi:hypothetical protein